MRNLKKFLALVLATLMVVSAMVATTASAATADHADAVKTLNRLNIYHGYGEGNMGANDLVTRWQMALFVARATTGFTDDSAWAGTTNTTPFTDVKANHYFGAIASAYNAGIINGVGDNKFAPEANIKYQEALAMAVRALGYTDLSYPIGYVAKAQELGLTDNLTELDNKLETAVTRGQIAEILLATITAETKAGTIIIRDILKYDFFDGKVVATSNQFIGAAALTKSGYVTLADGDETLTIKASLLLKDGQTADDLLGHTFEIATNNNYETLVTCTQISTEKTIENFGLDKTQFDRVNVGYAPNVKTRVTMIRVDGKLYGTQSKTQTGWLHLYTASGVSSTPGDVVKTHYYNTDGDIVETNGTIILYNLNGEYYVNLASGTLTALRKATAAEIEAAKRPLVDNAGNQVISAATKVCYEALADCRTAGYCEFGEIKLIDTDNNGVWDDGYFTPYKYGKYEVKTTSSDTKVDAMNFTTDKVVNAKSQKVAYINGAYLTGYNGEKLIDYVVAEGLKVEGTAPASGDYIIYKYNAYTGEFEVKANLGTPKVGNLTEINGQGSYVVIDGTKYKYNLGTVTSPANAGDSSSGADLTADFVELVGFNTADVNLTVAQSAIVNKTYAVKYLTVAGYVTYIQSIDPVYDFTGYVAFEPADIVKIDADGNLVVKAIVDATGAKKEIKIADFSNYKVGLRLADELKKMGFGVEDKYLIGSKAPTYKNADIIDAYIAARTYDADKNPSPMEDYINACFYAAKINANGTYSLVPHDSADAKLTAVSDKNAATITFSYGINDTQLVTKDSTYGTKGKFLTTSDTVYVFVGRDGVDVFKGVAPSDAKIYLTDTTTKLYSANAACIFVVDTTKAVDAIYDGWASTPSTPVTESDYVFFAVTKDTKASITVADKDGEATLTVAGFYNVITGASADVVVKADFATIIKPVYDAINGAAYGTVVVYSAEDSLFAIDAGYTTFEAYLDELWGDKPVYASDLGKLEDKLTFVVTSGDEAGTKTVKSYKLTTIWGIEGTVTTVDGSAVANFAQADKGNQKNPQDYAFWTIDANGNVTGYVFALDMSSSKDAGK